VNVLIKEKGNIKKKRVYVRFAIMYLQNNTKLRNIVLNHVYCDTIGRKTTLENLIKARKMLFWIKTQGVPFVVMIKFQGYCSCTIKIGIAKITSQRISLWLAQIAMRKTTT